jgi:hypothetical protein
MNHYLLIYNRRTGDIVDRAEFNGRSGALAARFKAEREHRGDADIEVVVLGAKSWAALSNTHSRYFRRVRQLADDALNRLAPAR